MTKWRPFPLHLREHTVVGTVLEYSKLYSPQLRNRRSIYVYLPPSYQNQPWQHYPVMYMHDGQNLFDRQTSYAGEWQVDELMEQFALEGHEAIVVGIANTFDDRIYEYAPVVEPRLGSGGRGDAYLDFVFDTVKPLIDAEFRTLPGRETTALLGSSMGGLISLYGFLRNPELVGLAGALSSSLWFGQDALFELLSALPPNSGRLYLDIGWNEYDDTYDPTEAPGSNAMLRTNRRFHALLQEQGYAKDRLLYVEDREGDHSEAAWARRLPIALRFLFGW